jgi:hypothetical protein
MCAPFLYFAMHAEQPPPGERASAPDRAPKVGAKAVPSMETGPNDTRVAHADDSPSYFDDNAESRVVLRRILFVPSGNDKGSERMDVLYDVDPDKQTVEIEEGEAIRGSVED